MINSVVSAARYISFSALLCAALASCSLPSETATETAAMASGSFSKDEVLGVIHTVNNGEIEQAQLALQKSSNASVRDAAQLIINDHTELNQRVDSLVRSGMKIEKSPLSRGIKLQADQIHDELSELSGTEFDCTYLQRQIEQHELVLETMRSDIQPDAKERQVKALIAETIPALERHLETTKELHSNIGQCSSS